MKNRSFIFGSFAHDAEGVLADIHQFALVSIKCSFNFLVRMSFELRVAAFAYADPCRGPFHDSQFAFRHVSSLAQSASKEECL